MLTFKASASLFKNTTMETFASLRCYAASIVS